MSGPLILAIESSCDETGVALVEDGRRIHANVVASQIALHAPTGGIVPEVAARAHLRWIVPVLDEALGTAGRDDRRTSTRSRSPTGPGSRARCWSGINVAKTLAWAHDKPLVAGQPPRGPRLRGLAARPGRGRARRAAVPARRARRVGRAHVPRRDARPPRLPAARPDRRRRRGRGVRQGRPAAGPRLPGRAGDLAGGRGARRRRTACSRGRGWATRTTSASRASRPPRGGSSAQARADEGLPADERDGALPGRRRRRARLGVPGLGRGRAGDEDDPGGRGGRGARDRARRRRGGERGAPGADRRRGRGARHPARHPAARPVHRQRGDDRRGRRAAARRGRARRASTSTPGRRCRSPDERRAARPPTCASTRATSATPQATPACAPRHGLSARTSSPTSTCSRGSCARPTRRRASACWRSGPGLGFLTGGLLAAGRAR